MLHRGRTEASGGLRIGTKGRKKLEKMGEASLEPISTFKREGEGARRKIAKSAVWKSKVVGGIKKIGKELEKEGLTLERGT